MKRFFEHVAGIAIATLAAVLLLQASLGLAMSQYINREMTMLTVAGAWISSAMLWPFGWIPVGVLPQGSSAFIIVYVFWGLLFYAGWRFWKPKSG